MEPFMSNPDQHPLAPKAIRRGRHAVVRNPLTLPTPLSAMQELPRRVIVPGLLDASGEPMLGLSLGHPRRPLLVALGATLGTLSRCRAGGGA
jgi:hypothetical protein